MNYADFYNELEGTIPKLSILLAQRFVNRAWRDIRKRRLWSFLVDEALIFMPPVIQAGTASVTQFSNQVTPDATLAKPAWLAAGPPGITLMQFRVSTGPLYNISAINNASGVITLDRLYLQSTNATTTYQIYQAYYPAPVSDFVRFRSVFDPLNAYWLGKNWTREKLDNIDPQRASQGQPHQVVPYKQIAVGGVKTPFFELWEHPTSTGTLQVVYERQGAEFVNENDTAPPVIEDDLIMERSRYHGYKWASVNVGRFPELRGVDWNARIMESMKEYEILLNKAMLQDEEVFAQNVILAKSEADFPISASYVQAHDTD